MPLPMKYFPFSFFFIIFNIYSMHEPGFIGFVQITQSRNHSKQNAFKFFTLTNIVILEIKMLIAGFRS